jgi:ABC-type uncharacterized transport system permease subunit
MRLKEMNIDVKFWLKVSVIVLATAALGAGVIIYAEAFSAFGVALILADLVCLKLYLIDKFFLRRYDTLELIAKGNMAPAVLLIPYSIILLGAIIAAFVVWIPQP